MVIPVLNIVGLSISLVALVFAVVNWYWAEKILAKYGESTIFKLEKEEVDEGDQGTSGTSERSKGNTPESL